MDWIPSIFRRRERYDDLSEEIHLHIEERAEQLMSQGMSAEEATREARRAFGNRTVFEERSREVWQWPTLESIWADVRIALRQMRRSPGFTIAAMLTLALAIGANAVVFGVLNAVLLRPLDVPNAKSLYAFETAETQIGHQSYPDYLDFRARNRSFEDLAAFSISQAVLDSGANPSRIWGYETSGNYFDVLGIQPFLGRFFHAVDERGPNSAPYVVLAYAYWHSHFQDDRGVVGRTVLVNKHPFTVIGVAPPAFQGTLLFFSADCFMPIVDRNLIDEGNQLNERGTRIMFEPFGHLKQGVTQTQALADLSSIGSYLEATYPKDDGHKNFTLIRPGFPNFLGRPVRAFVAALMLLAGLILLAACANLGSLFAARAADRSREIALRLALGSSRKRILRQLLTEALLLSLAGGAAGLFVSVALLRRLSVWQPFPELAIHVPASPDANVYLTALALALVSGLLFGMVPVRQVLQANPYGIVKAGSAGMTGRRTALRDVLLVIQIAICAVLVTSAMAAVRGLARSLHGSFGFELRNAMVAGVELKMTGYTGDRVSAIEKRMVDAMEVIPGVEQAALVNNPPLVAGGGWTTNVFKDETRDLRPSNVASTTFQYNISPEYFRAAGTALLSGRTFTPQDSKDAPGVAVINQEFARRIFGSEKDALGRYFKAADGSRHQVVGLVEDGKYFNFSEAQQPAMFLPLAQTGPLIAVWLVVRSARDPQQLAAAMRSQLHALDAGLPCEIETWTKGMNFALFPARMATISLGVLGLLGALLSITGIFGMAAYSVSKRLKELGIRVALGARRKEVVQAALGRALRLLAIGSTAGLLVGILASRLLAFIVFQASPRDPLVLAGVILAMSLLGLLATWIPARRALSVNPVILLREE
jgi:macrolide transport system ATP-binding/permease protein